MKREYPENDGGKKKMAEEQPDTGVDELLAALGYKVRSSDMADVAQKLEQLEVAMSAGAATSSTTADEAFISHLASDTIHYNPSELSTWLESMLAEINAPPPPPNSPPKPSATVDFPQHDLKHAKRMRTEAPSMNPVVVVAPAMDSQETGIQLVHAMMACAEAAQQENFKAADVLVKQISTLAASQGGAMGKVAGYFAKALSRRIYRMSPSQKDLSFSDLLEAHFYESCPYLKFAHFTANQAILDAFAGCSRVHVIDFGIKQGMQWPALMQALALRLGGPPSFRLTGVGNSDAIHQVGWKLAQFADSVGVKFEYRSFVASNLADLEPYLFESPAGEPPMAVAVNSVFEMHRLLAQQGAVESVFATIRAMKPRIVTVVEQESSHNTGSFVERFTEALHYYSTMFDSLEGGSGATAEQQQDRVMSEVYLGRQICNVVACEGSDRTERHETLNQWRTRFGRAGFDPVLLGSNAYKQASMLLAFFADGDGYKVEEREGCLTLGWHNRPLIATSAWRLADSPAM